MRRHLLFSLMLLCSCLAVIAQNRQARGINAYALSEILFRIDRNTIYIHTLHPGIKILRRDGPTEGRIREALVQQASNEQWIPGLAVNKRLPG